MSATLGGFLDLTAVLAFAYFAFLGASYVILGTTAFFALRRHAARARLIGVDELLASAGAPGITLIAPAFNEEATCVESVRSLLALRYPEYEIVVVNDGSRDATLARLSEAFSLQPADRLATASLPTRPVRGVFRSARHPRLWVVDKDNGGKADALNAGLNHCRTPVFCAMDADTLLERDALVRIVRPFLEDGRTICAGAIVRIANGSAIAQGAVSSVRLPDSWLARFQILEYLRAFLSGRMGWSAFGATLIVSGAFGLFDRAVVVDAGGYAGGTVGEDMELVVRLHRHCRQRGRPYRIAFVPEPVAWTECPESLQTLGRQRDRWQRGLAEVMRIHRAMLFNVRHGVVGLFALPYHLFLEMFGPAIELLGYIGLVLALATGHAGIGLLSGFLAIAFLLGASLSFAAVALGELTFHRYARSSDILRLFLLGILDCFGYRQLSSWWRIRGLFSFLRGRKEWGAMERRGFATPATEARS